MGAKDRERLGKVKRDCNGDYVKYSSDIPCVPVSQKALSSWNAYVQANGYSEHSKVPQWKVGYIFFYCLHSQNEF